MLVAVVGFIFGTILGSFSKAAADRIKKKESLEGRSYCQKCKTPLRWYDLFPVISFILLKGRCRNCHKKIPLSNFLSEVVLGFIVALIFLFTIPSDALTLSLDLNSGLFILDLVFKLFVICVISIIFWTDTITGLIPDKVTYPAIIVAIAYLISFSAFKSWIFYQNLLNINNPFGKYLLPPYSSYLWDNLERIWFTAGLTVLAAIGMALIFILLIVITKGRGMGWGDVKYVLWLGLAVGFPNIIPAVFLAFFTGAVFSIGLIVFGQKHFGQTIPFGPFLGAGAILAMLWGNQLINLYF